MEGLKDEEEAGKSKVSPELAEKFERAIQEALQFLDERPIFPSCCPISRTTSPVAATPAYQS
jgi:hypothetical protein